MSILHREFNRFIEIETSYGVFRSTFYSYHLSLTKLTPFPNKNAATKIALQIFSKSFSTYTVVCVVPINIYFLWYSEYKLLPWSHSSPNTLFFFFLFSLLFDFFSRKTCLLSIYLLLVPITIIALNHCNLPTQCSEQWLTLWNWMFIVYRFKRIAVLRTWQ